MPHLDIDKSNEMQQGTEIQEPVASPLMVEALAVRSGIIMAASLEFSHLYVTAIRHFNVHQSYHQQTTGEGNLQNRLQHPTDLLYFSIYLFRLIS